jgi:hypothetical protein
MSDGLRRAVLEVDEDRALDALALAWVMLTRFMSSVASGRRGGRVPGTRAFSPGARRMS